VAGEREFEQEIEALLSRHFISALSADPDRDPAGGQIYQTVIEQVERPLIKLALAATNGNKVRAAALLGLNRFDRKTGAPAAASSRPRALPEWME
jgi:two-component system nitrogen regulation response regulator GlnG